MPRVDDPGRLLRGIGRRVAELRVEHGYTQEQLAERAGVSTRYLQRVEAGRQNLTIETLARFSRMLGVRTSELLEEPSSEAPGPGRPRARSRARRR